MGCSEKCNDCEVQDALINTLADYEDTNLIPERIIEVDKLYLEKCQEVNSLNAELAELKKQLPPCSVGDIVYRINRGAKTPSFLSKYYVSKYLIETLLKISRWNVLTNGKAVISTQGRTLAGVYFLTETEAKAALKRLESE